MECASPRAAAIPACPHSSPERAGEQLQSTADTMQTALSPQGALSSHLLAVRAPSCMVTVQLDTNGCGRAEGALQRHRVRGWRLVGVSPEVDAHLMLLRLDDVCEILPARRIVAEGERGWRLAEAGLPGRQQVWLGRKLPAMHHAGAGNAHGSCLERPPWYMNTQLTPPVEPSPVRPRMRPLSMACEGQRAEPRQHAPQGLASGCMRQLQGCSCDPSDQCCLGAEVAAWGPGGGYWLVLGPAAPLPLLLLQRPQTPARRMKR
jgi:hypothetical protein